MWLTFSGDVDRDDRLPRNPDIERQNADELEGFLARQTAAGRRSPRQTRTRHPHWRDVPGEAVAALLEALQTPAAGHRRRRDASSPASSATGSRTASSTTWTVVLINNSHAAHRATFAELEIGLTVRGSTPDAELRSGRRAPGEAYTIRRLGSQSHELSTSTTRSASAPSDCDRAHEAARRSHAQRARTSTSQPPADRPVRPRGPPVETQGCSCSTPWTRRTRLDGEVAAVPGWLVSFPEIAARRRSVLVPGRYVDFDQP